ncbi:MAG TPA: MEDS domain-containing protein [Candidatus Acidoferrum sp.]|jgi:excisionase family DNA binding protein|nr:MEDS domain-containing protein [Candidatus Acidoferrum sp.]
MSTSLLNTKEAARLLRVSEASIRRWSDSGLLSARRVGRRRERRFERSELERFLGGATPERPADPSSVLGLGGVSIPPRGHFAPIFSTDAGGLLLTVPFLADGLRAGQACFLAASGDVLDRYARALAAEAIDFQEATRSGQLVVLNWPGATAAEVIAHWERLFVKALASRPSMLRVAGDMASERQMFPSEAEMMAYEEAYDRMARRFPLVTLCAYDARQFSGETILRMLKAHPDMFQGHLGLFLS